MSYDANGNLITDLDRDIVTIRYNLLNLPELIQFRNGNQIKNMYAADGRKLYVHLVTLAPGVFNPLNPGQVIDGLDVNELEIVTVTGTDYVNNKEYAVSRYFDWDATYKPKDLRSLQRTLNPEGYAMNATTISETSEASYHYYRRDHLGNNREVWRASYKWGNKVNPATTLQLTQYYPSGLPWKTNTGDSPSTQPYKYGGKEFVEAHGLDEYDSHARWYYPAIMRTTTRDPLAEKYYSISPYAWCGNNPVRFVDPDGRDWLDRVAGGIIGIATNIIPGSTDLRNSYTPNNASDYNSTLQVIDAVAIVAGAGMVTGGQTGVGAGTTIVIAGGATAATVVGAPEGAAIAGTGAIVIAGSEALSIGGIVVMANATNNASKGYNYGEKKGNTSSGNKNSPHANQKAKQSAEQKYNDAKRQYDDLKSKPNKTPEEKKQLDQLKRTVDHQQKKMQETGETHSRNAKGNR